MDDMTAMVVRHQDTDLTNGHTNNVDLSRAAARVVIGWDLDQRPRADSGETSLAHEWVEVAYRLRRSPVRRILRVR